MRACPKCFLTYPDDSSFCFVDGTALGAREPTRVGTVLGGRYALEAVIARGGMSTVYRARHTIVERLVAIKLVETAQAEDTTMRERFRREAKHTASLSHPNIIEVYDFGTTDDGASYIVMEYLEGSPLSEIIAKGPMPIETVLSTSIQIARGLARAHDLHVTHRDLKPANVVVVRGRPLVKLLDFGIAQSLRDQRLTAQGEAYGTPHYMAPERILSNDARPSVDLYSLGVMLFQMVTGRLPFLASDTHEYMRKQLQEAPPSPSMFVRGIPAALEQLILRLMAKKPDERPVDAHQVAGELAAISPTARESAASLVSAARRSSAPPVVIAQTGWIKRAAVMERLTREAFRSETPPPEHLGRMARVKALVTKLHESRDRALVTQRAIDALDDDVHGTRERIVRALDTIAADLSVSRQELRDARVSVTPYAESEALAEATYHTRVATLPKDFSLEQLHEVTDEIANAVNSVAEALQSWNQAKHAALKAGHWLQSKNRQVEDLEFQAQALHQQLERLSMDRDGERTELVVTVQTIGTEIGAFEAELHVLCTELAEPFAEHPEAQELLADLTRQPR